jgi:putative addiction module antidote
MTQITKVSKQGNSLGVRIPKKMLEKMGLSQGDEVALTLSEGRIQISKADQAYNRAMELGREGAVRYHHTLAKLAQ